MSRSRPFDLRRQKREQQDMLKTAILTAASQILSEEGFQCLSARKLAARVGASTKVIYSHFGSMPELIEKMYERAFDQLFQELDRADRAGGTIAERLLRVANGYRSFALRNKELFGLMYGEQTAALLPTRDERQVAVKTLDVIIRILSDSSNEDASSIARPRLRAYQFWSAIHGPVSLEISEWLQENQDEIFQFVVSAAIERITADQTVPR
ncbi:MAG: TetR/AcrR family transcriptional regulator [Pseudomonadota bacterium]